MLCDPASRQLSTHTFWSDCNDKAWDSAVLSTQRCLQEKKGKATHKTKMTVFSMWQNRHVFFNYFYFAIFRSSFSTFLGGNRRQRHHLEIFIAVS